MGLKTRDCFGWGLIGASRWMIRFFGLVLKALIGIHESFLGIG
jgi:hypothetical protein